MCLYVAGEPAGYVEIDRRQAPDVSLNYFGLMPEFTGRGIGWYFVNWAIDSAWEPAARGVSSVDTCTLDHPRALQIYQRAGFQPLTGATADPYRSAADRQGAQATRAAPAVSGQLLRLAESERRRIQMTVGDGASRPWKATPC